MSPAKEIMNRVKQQRRFEEAVNALRRRTRRNTRAASLLFPLALFNLWQAWSFGVTMEIEGKEVLLAHGVMSAGAALSLFLAGILSVWVNPSDRLLLLLAEEALLQRAAHKQPPEQTLSSIVT